MQDDATSSLSEERTQWCRTARSTSRSSLSPSSARRNAGSNAEAPAEGEDDAFAASVAQLEAERSVDGFTLNPYTADAIALLALQRQAQQSVKGQDHRFGNDDGAAAAAEAAMAVAGVKQLTELLGEGPGPGTAAASPPPVGGGARKKAGQHLSLPGIFDDDAVAALRAARGAELAGTEGRRHVARRRADLVDDLFQRAVDRRLRAIRRVAADPPADRLVGHGMAQYIPADLFPGQRRPMAAVGHSPPPQQQQQQRAHASGSRVAAAASGSPPSVVSAGVDGGGNALVFLTEMDGPDERPSTSVHRRQQQQQQQQRGLELHTVGGSGGLGGYGGGHNSSSSGAERDVMGAAPPPFLTDAEAEGPRQQVELRAHWRELGYDIVLVSSANATTTTTTSGGADTHQRIKAVVESSSSSPCPFPPATASPQGMAAGASAVAATILAVNGDVLGGSYLLQRRLPEGTERDSGLVVASHGRRRAGARNHTRWNSSPNQGE